jgi:hypothetical protein
MSWESPLSVNAKSFRSPPPQRVGNCQVTHKIRQNWLFPESQTPPQSQCCRPVSIPASNRSFSTSLTPVRNWNHCFNPPPPMHRAEGEIQRNHLQYPSTSSRPQLLCHAVCNLASKAGPYSCSASRTSSSIGSSCCCCSSLSWLRSSHAYTFQNSAHYLQASRSHGLRAQMGSNCDARIECAWAFLRCRRVSEWKIRV